MKTLYQLVVVEQTVQHCDELLKAHTGDPERELIKALKKINVWTFQLTIVEA